MQPNWRTDSLAELGEEIWGALSRACRGPGDPWRLPALATVGESGPQVRTVVLREASSTARHLVAWTDGRSPKVAELRGLPRAQWLFHDPANGVQLRVTTVVQVHRDDEVARAAWATVPDVNRANYQGTEVPGSVLAHPASARRPANAALPMEFTLLVASVSEFDWLWLDPAGHRRARFRWGGEQWAGEWLVP